MTLILWVALLLVYFLIGALYNLTYVLIFKPAAPDATIGLTMLFWPIFILIELVLALASQFGRATRAMSAKLSTAIQ